MPSNDLTTEDIVEIKKLISPSWFLKRKRKDYLKKIEGLQRAPQTKTSLLMTQNANLGDCTLGMIIAARDGEKQTLAYLRLLENLLQEGVAANEILKLLLIKNSPNAFFQDYLVTAKAQYIYINLRTALLKNGASSAGMHELWKRDETFIVEGIFSLKPNWDDEILKCYICFLLEMVKCNIRPSEMSPFKLGSIMLRLIYQYCRKLADPTIIFQLVNTGLATFIIDSDYGNTNPFYDKAFALYQYILKMPAENKLIALENANNPEHTLGKFLQKNLVKQTLQEMRGEFAKLKSQNNFFTSANIMLQIKDLKTKQKWLVSAEQLKQGVDLRDLEELNAQNEISLRMEKGSSTNNYSRALKNSHSPIYGNTVLDAQDNRLQDCIKNQTIPMPNLSSGRGSKQ